MNLHQTIASIAAVASVVGVSIAVVQYFSKDRSNSKALTEIIEAPSEIDVSGVWYVEKSNEYWIIRPGEGWSYDIDQMIECPEISGLDYMTDRFPSDFSSRKKVSKHIGYGTANISGSKISINMNQGFAPDCFRNVFTTELLPDYDDWNGRFTYDDHVISGVAGRKDFGREKQLVEKFTLRKKRGGKGGLP